jgi:hypothetical protein
MTEHTRLRPDGELGYRPQDLQERGYKPAAASTVTEPSSAPEGSAGTSSSGGKGKR